MAWLAGFLLTVPIAFGQAPPSYFTIAAFSDVHIDDQYGNPSPINRQAWAAAKAWIIDHRDTWNIQGVIGTGDYVAYPTRGATADWAGFANDLNDLVAAGIPVVASPGNHDTVSTDYALWDAFLGSVIAGWPLTAQFAGSYPALPAFHPLAANQYRRLDIATSAGIMKLGIGALEWSPSLADVTTLKGYMDADVDRDFVLGTHIFLSAIAGTDASHPCVYDDTDCITSGYAKVGYLDGARIWDALKDNAGLRAIVTGHSHTVSSAQMTGTSGNVVQALSTWNVGYRGWGNIILMRFRTDNRTIEFYSWKTAQNVADQDAWGSPKIVAWNARPTVTPTATTSLLASSANPSIAGSNLALTATISGKAPTGTVTFADFGVALADCGAVALTGAGDTRTAVCTTAALAAGTHNITANYGGDASNLASTSDPLAQIVNPATVTATNVALASAGATATASSAASPTGYSPSIVINGDHKGLRTPTTAGWWMDATPSVFPDWVQINFAGSKTVDHVVVYSLQDNYNAPVEPSPTLTFKNYGVVDFTVDGWNGSGWVTLGAVTGNNLVMRTVNFAAFTTDRIRINVSRSANANSRLVEVEVWGSGPEPSATRTALASSVNPSMAGSNLALTATIGGRVPTGTVTFADFGVALADCGAVALTGSGDTRTAVCTTAALAAGTHSITAHYAGDASNLASTSDPLTQVVDPATVTAINVALASAGATATASSAGSPTGYSPSIVINGDHKGLRTATTAGWWMDATPYVFPDWVQVNFAGSKTIDHVVVYSLQDNYNAPVEPFPTLTFKNYGVVDFTVDGWDGSGWVTLGAVTGNNLVMRSVNFAAVTTDRIRINVTRSANAYSRLVEVEAWGN